MKISTLFMFTLLCAGSTIASADTLLMRDGTTREGTVVSRNAQEVQLRMGSGGIQATVKIPMSDVVKITITPPAPKAPPKIQSPRPAENVATPAPLAELPRRGFLVELAATAMGKGPDNPARLPDNLRNLWETAVRRESLGNKADTLQALRDIDTAFSSLKDGMARLDGVCRHERNGESFGEWLAKTHWDVMATKFAGGQFDLKDLRESEKKPLIGILREKTAPALEPLKSYFPPLDDKTGKPQPYRPSQLSGIGVSNALQVKQQASFAGAVLLAQIKLEPQMPAVDRLLLGSELQTVHRIMSKASDAEPAAKAAAEKAEREKRIAEEKARHGG